jgi:hypothetical protein
MTHGSVSEKGRAGQRWFRRLLLAAGIAAAVLVLIFCGLRWHVTQRARTVEQRILEERRDTETAAATAARNMERYLAMGEKTRLAVDGPTLTRFIEGRYGGQVPDSVSSWRVNLMGGEALLEGVVNLERYLGELGLEQPSSLSGLNGGDIPFSVRGRLEAEDGRGRFTVEAVSLLGLPLPLDLVERVGRSGGGDSVLIQHFDLPRGIERAVIDEDQVVINGSPAAS